MNLKKIGGLIGKYAPILARAAMDPAGTAISLVASAFGGDPQKPDELATLIQNDPEAATKLRKIEFDHGEEMAKIAMQAEHNAQLAEAAKLQTVNATMQAESKSEHWIQYSWRPYWGFISGTAFFVLVSFICYLAYKAIMSKDPNAMAMMPTLISQMAILFAIPGGILGVSAWHRGKAKVVAEEKRGTK